MESGEFPQYIKECFVSMVFTLHVLEPYSLKAACLFMMFSNPTASYVGTLPNEIERDSREICAHSIMSCFVRICIIAV